MFDILSFQPARLMVDFTNDLMGEFLMTQKGVFNDPNRIS
jgi:hypothetical protein